jgi:aspartate/methionine/tyrosine aminotransferase
MEIEHWLQRFKERWKSHNVDGVMELFAEGVDYYETPFRKLESRQEIRAEWMQVKQQRNIEIDTDVFASQGSKHAVKYALKYTEDGDRRELRGVYLVTLNEEGECTEIWQYFQEDS